MVSEKFQRNDNHVVDEHYCFICKETDADHTPCQCSQKCNMPRCTDLHHFSKHKCFVCEVPNVAHISDDCLLRCTVEGCTGYHQTYQHYCDICKKHGVDHMSDNCPEKCIHCGHSHKTSEHIGPNIGEVQQIILLV